MAMNYWDSAYASGHVPWDPGEYDGHLPGIIEHHGIVPSPALDVGCGSGKSVVWLARHGFDCTGIEISPEALKQARELADRHGVRCSWLLGTFPEDFTNDLIGHRRFQFIMDRGWFHLHTDRDAQRRIVHAISRLLAPSGIWYSLIAAGSKSGMWSGPPRWTAEEVRRAVDHELEILRIDPVVFTPGEEGSMAAWLCAFRKPG